MKTDKRVRRSLIAALTGEDHDRIAETLRLIRLDKEADRPAGLLSPACSRTARSSGWRSACC